MAKVLILAESGFGKTTSIGPVEKLGIKGLNPEETFIMTVNTKGLPIPGWMNLYPESREQATKGNLALGVDASTVGNIIAAAGKREEIRNLVLDDSNYIMQDYYMSKALTSGYDVFKKIGAMMSAVFLAMDAIPKNKNFFMLAHFEEYRNSNLDTISFRFKTVGKMVQDYITPEGKFEIVLYGRQTIVTGAENKKVLVKQFVTNYDGQYPAKSPYGMFEELYIPNDLGYVVAAINAYNHGEILTQEQFYTVAAE
jgi:hypothetical protein